MLDREQLAKGKIDTKPYSPRRARSSDDKKATLLEKASMCLGGDSMSNASHVPQALWAYKHFVAIDVVTKSWEDVGTCSFADVSIGARCHSIRATSYLRIILMLYLLDRNISVQPH